ncbi:hypothetical protein AB4Z54_08875, partial [Streptomyces sp. MCAF7]
LKDLVAEMKATNAAFARSKREVFKSAKLRKDNPNRTHALAPTAGDRSIGAPDLPPAGPGCGRRRR